MRAASKANETAMEDVMARAARGVDESKQEQEQEQEQEQGTTSLYQPPAPAWIQEEPKELYRLLAAHHEGKLQPAAIQLGELPPGAGGVMRHVAEHMRLLMGLRAAVGDDRPLPYASSMALRAGITTNQGTASSAIGSLVRAGVIDYVGSLPPQRPGLDGTKLYAPPSVRGPK